MAVQPRHLEQAQNIQQGYDRRAKEIRERRDLTPDARNGLLAKYYLDAKQQLSRIQQTATQETAADRNALEQRAFGINGLPGADQATIATSYRDAQDRAAGLNSSRDAMSMLTRANRTGDEPLARAIAAHAYDMTSSAVVGGLVDSGWDEVLDAYLEPRPSKVSTIQSLADMSRAASPSANLMTQMFAFALPAPGELSGLSGAQVEHLAASADAVVSSGTW